MVLTTFEAFALGGCTVALIYDIAVLAKSYVEERRAK